MSLWPRLTYSSRARLESPRRLRILLCCRARNSTDLRSRHAWHGSVLGYAWHGSVLGYAWLRETSIARTLFATSQERQRCSESMHRVTTAFRVHASRDNGVSSPCIETTLHRCATRSPECLYPGHLLQPVVVQVNALRPEGRWRQ